MKISSWLLICSCESILFHYSLRESGQWKHLGNTCVHRSITRARYSLVWASTLSPVLLDLATNKDMAINITFQFCYESFSELLWTDWKFILVAKSSLAQICCKILTGFRLGIQVKVVCLCVMWLFVCVWHVLCTKQYLHTYTVAYTLHGKVLPGYLLIHYWASCPAIFSL